MQTRCLGLWLCLAAALASGCTTSRDFPAPSLSCSVRLIDVGAATAERWNPTAGENNLAVRTVASKPSNVLVLSGGGMNGAYPAGLLKGWTESGTRPRFDVVTGI